MICMTCIWLSAGCLGSEEECRVMGYCEFGLPDHFRDFCSLTWRRHFLEIPRTNVGYKLFLLKYDITSQIFCLLSLPPHLSMMNLRKQTNFVEKSFKVQLKFLRWNKCYLNVLWPTVSCIYSTLISLSKYTFVFVYRVVQKLPSVASKLLDTFLLSLTLQLRNTDNELNSYSVELLATQLTTDKQVWTNKCVANL